MEGLRFLTAFFLSVKVPDTPLWPLPPRPPGPHRRPGLRHTPLAPAAPAPWPPPPSWPARGRPPPPRPAGGHPRPSCPARGHPPPPRPARAGGNRVSPLLRQPALGCRTPKLYSHANSNYIEITTFMQKEAKSEFFILIGYQPLKLLKSQSNAAKIGPHTCETLTRL